MVDKKYQNILFAFFMALFMSCIMSIVICLHNFGFVENILFIWLKSWGFAFVVAFPTVSVVAPIVRKIVGKIVSK